MHRGGGGAGHPPLPRRPRRSRQDPVPAAGGALRGAQQRHRARQRRGSRQVGGRPGRARARRHPARRSPTRAPASIPPQCPSRSGPSSSTRPMGGASISSGSSWTRSVQRARELHLHDTAPSVGRLDLVVDGLGALVHGRVRLWRYDGRALRLAAGPIPASRRRCRGRPGSRPRPPAPCGSSP